MHSVPLDYVVIDEASLMPYIIYDTRLVPRLADSGGWIAAIGTPEDYEATGEWFTTFYDIGQTDNDLGIKSWTLKLEDNKFEYTAKGGETSQEVADEYSVNRNKLERDNPEVSWPLGKGQVVVVFNYDKEWLEDERKRMSPAIYAARFEASRGTNPYTVFPNWNDKVYVDFEEKHTKFDKELPVYLAIDPGGTYAVAAVQFKQREGNTNQLTKGYDLCIIDELYYQTTITTQQVFDMCSAKGWWPNINRKSHSWWPSLQGAIDATSNEQQMVWAHLGRNDTIIESLHLASRKGDINAGTATLQHFLDTNSIWVSPHCTYWRMEMRKYIFRPPSFSNVTTEDPRKSDTPKDAWNHLIKAVIYLIVCKFGYYGKSNNNIAVTREQMNELYHLNKITQDAERKRKGVAVSKWQ